MNGKIEWVCPSNIALVKYWGKKPRQIPANPSLSFTLSESVTRLQLEYTYKPGSEFSMEFLFNDSPESLFGRRTNEYLQNVMPLIPELRHVKMKINSSNTFPHSAGIASSASSFGALALALSSMRDEIRRIPQQQDGFFGEASSMARIGSGSACRSVYGGYVLWGSFEDYPGSSDIAACKVTEIDPGFMNLKDSILVVSSEPKTVSSSKGHQLMNENVFAPDRRIQALKNLQLLMRSLSEGKMNDFFNVSENEALTLHAMMMTSSPGYILMKPATLAIINKIRNFRMLEGLPVSFTMDAGPNVHLLYPGSAEGSIRKLINEELTEHCERVIHDFIGKGPVRIS